MAGDAPWQVRIALDATEVGALEAAMYVVLPAERWELRLPRIEDEGAPILSIEVRTEKHEQAERQASEWYARARQQADLSPREAQVLGALSPIFAASPHKRLLDEAAKHIEHQRYEWAVVRAQTACELYGKLALAHFARKIPNGGERSFRTGSLGHRHDRQLFRDLTGVELGREAWWSSYRRHLDRRHEIVHEGISVTEREAQESIDAATAFIAFLQARWAGA
jgi:HEPN domain-containing protein